ncbi:MAG: hypothetical protein WBO45_17655, partial [Planctomycetota bacterium]
MSATCHACGAPMAKAQRYCGGCGAPTRGHRREVVARERSERTATGRAAMALGVACTVPLFALAL